MIRAAALPMLFLVAAAGCVRRDGRNTDCHWPGEIAAKALKADQPGYGKHLSEDAEFAEDLAIRYTDAHHGPRSGHFESHEAAGRARNRCLTAMFGEVAKAHAVTPAEVFKFLGRNRGLIDLAVNLPFALLYGFAMSMIAGRILSRHRQGGGFGVVGLVLLGSLACGAAGVLLGEQWSTAAESIRVGSGHLSYRVDRVAWVRYRSELFALTVALFWAVAAVRRTFSPNTT